MRTDFSDSDTITINGFTYSADMATVLSVDKGVSSLNEMQRGVRYIGVGAFKGCENLRIVRIPETVIRIEDFAFRDCSNIQEVHLPYDMEYISPLAFTFSEEASSQFYNSVEVFIPKDAFLKYTYMIPQFIPVWSYKDYGLTDEDMKDAYGEFWDDIDGSPIYVNEDELYRMAIKDTIRYKLKVGESLNTDSDREQEIYDSVLHSLFEEQLCDFLCESSLVNTDNNKIVNNVDDSFGTLMEYRIMERYKLSQNYRPIELICDVMEDALTMGFIPSSVWQYTDDSELYDENLFNYLSAVYGDISCGFLTEDVEKNSKMSAWYNDMKIDTERLLWLFLRKYAEYSYAINVAILKRIIRQSMRMLFHIGYSYGMQYKKNNQLSL
ncbi:MAG: leucine-rich repeat protein [Prevotella sp.]|nr:leucine-rich repeat protein [Prevotella sp.]